jgi:hypothetical protein
VQGWTRRKKEALMADDSYLLHHLAKCQNESHFRRLDSVSHHILQGIDNQSSYLSTESSYLSEAEDSEAETI